MISLLGQQTWQGAAAWSVLLALVALATLVRSPGRRRSLVAIAAREAALVMALLGTWRFVGRYVRLRTEGGFDNARTVVHVQRVLHLPDEAVLQHWLLPHSQVIQAANLYYAGLHLPSMSLFLAWMWWRHRRDYGRARTTVVLVTLVSLLIQFVPVAPPRMFPELGFVDAALLHGQSVYGIGGSAVGSQLAAMPSVHVGWALILGLYLWRHGGRWGRVVGVTHATLTVAVVTVTANHWWLDGIVAAGLVAGAVGLQGVARSLLERRQSVPLPPEPVATEPVLAR